MTDGDVHGDDVGDELNDLFTQAMRMQRAIRAKLQGCTWAGCSSTETIQHTRDALDELEAGNATT